MSSTPTPVPTAADAAPAQPVVVPVYQSREDGVMSVIKDRENLKYVSLATMAFLLVSSPYAYRLTRRMNANFADPEGCGTVTGDLFHAAVFAAVSAGYSFIDCNGKALDGTARARIAAWSFVVYFVSVYAVRRGKCTYRYPSSGQDRGMLNVWNSVVPAVVFFVLSYIGIGVDRAIFPKEGWEQIQLGLST
jgi:hypothetical protein